jgi:hypothetical protein
MAETTNDKNDDTSGSGGIVSRITSFLTEPLGMGLALGAAVTLFLLWRVF